MKKLKNLKRLLMQLYMLKRILTLVFDAKWTSLINSVPACKTACDSLKAFVDGIDAKIADYRKVIKGIATQKRAARLALADASFAIMSSVRSWALQNGNLTLAAQMDVNLSDLRKMRYIVLCQKMKDTVAIVQPLVSQLASFNVTPVIFAAWQDKLQDMNDILTGPKSASDTRKSLGSIIATDMKTTMDFFDNQLTTLMSNFMDTPEFYVNFQNAKRIGLPDTHHTRLLAHVQDELGKNYFGITVTVDTYIDPKTGKSYPSASAVTDEKGNCDVSAFFAGMRTVTITGSTIEKTTFPAMQFEKGKAISFTFTCKPSFTNIPAPEETRSKQKV